LALALALASSGCWFKKKPVIAIPAPIPKPATIPSQPAPAPPEIDPPKEIPVGTPAQVPPVPPAQIPSGPPPATRNPRPPAPKPTPPPSGPVPQLGTLLTPERRAQMTAEYDKLLGSTRSILAAANPAASKADQMNRVQSLIQQAEAARPKDLAAALQLIQRANVLARDLARP